MQRLTYLVIAAIGISAVNLVLLIWVIVPLEWDLKSEWFPVSVNSKNETTYQQSYGPSIFSSGGSSASGAIDDLRHDNKRLREQLACLDSKALYSGGYGC